MAYAVSEHKLLNASATLLAQDDEETFLEQQAWAESQLGVSGTAYTGSQKKLVERALALQINWQLQLPADVWYVKQGASTQSRQNITYRDGIQFVDPRAAALIAQVETEATGDIGGRYGNIRSIR